MKKLHMGRVFLKALLIAGLMTSCQNEDTLIPADSNGITVMDENAKANAELKLTKDGLKNLEYIKSGRLTGYISKVYGQYYNTEYSYKDSIDNLWITSKTFHKATNSLIEEIKYKILRDRCVTSINVKTGWTYQYSYNENARLIQIDLSNGALTQKKVFTYTHIAATGADRLNHIVSSTPVGDYEDISFNYTTNGAQNTTKNNKYHLNPEHTGLDMYLPFFGKFSDQLVQQVEVKPLPYSNQTKPYFRFFYVLDNGGYAISRERIFYPLGNGNEAGKQSYISELKYSTYWQGL